MSATQYLNEFVNAVNERNTGAFFGLLTPEFYSYTAQGDEPIASQVMADLVDSVALAFPDFKLTLADVREEDGEAKATMTATGTYTGALWEVPGDQQAHEFTATVVARLDGERIALRWEGPEFIPTMRLLGIMPVMEKAHLRAEHPPRVPETMIKLAFNGMKLTEKPCAHLDMIKMVEPVTHVCAACEEDGTIWPALRMCLTCGYTGCCDTSIHKHAKSHAEETGHALFRSIQPGESWAWCYEDHAFLGSHHLKNR
jgi:hypothetical protein